MRRILIQCAMVWFMVHFAYGQNPYPAWSNTAAITLNTTATGANLPGTANESNIPVLIKLGAGYFDFSAVKAGGADIRFSSSTGTTLPYEIESWDDVHKTAWIWVLVNQIQGNTSNTINLHWGNAAAVSESNGSGVFKSTDNYLAVWHLGEDGNTTPEGYKDASNNGYHGTGINTTAITDVLGVAGKCQSFSGTKNFIDIPTMQNTETGTFEHWTKFPTPTISGLTGIFMADAWSGGRLHYQWSDRGIHFDHSGNGNLLFSNSKITLDQWNHVAISFNRANTELKLYVNGALLDTKSWDNQITFTNVGYTMGGWAGYTDPDRFSNATFDEFRISNSVRSADLIKLNYENQRPDQSLVNLPSLVGCVENFGVGSATVSGNEAVDVVVQGNANCALRFYWVEVNGQTETPIGGNLPLILNSGRISADSIVNIRLKALYGTTWRTADVQVTFTKSVQNPIFTLASPIPIGQIWDGKQTIEIKPAISNAAQISLLPAPFNTLNYNWFFDKISAAHSITDTSIILTYGYAQNSSLNLCLDNGGPTLCQKLLLPAGIPTIANNAGTADPLLVFILAGQSNMEGHGEFNMNTRVNEGKGTLEYILMNTTEPDSMNHLINTEDGDWMARNDVWIKYDSRKGGVSTGYGVNENKMGPELQFGHVIGNALPNQVLLIKVAKGGRALATDWRPPSSGVYSVPQADGDTGYWYQQIITQTNEVVTNLSTHFPEYNGNGYRITGFGWHQGWNDGINPERVAEYTVNLTNFINDIRGALNVSNLPFVIAENGNMCSDPNGPTTFCDAQRAPASDPQFNGTVAAVTTREFWVPAEESPSGQGSHWNLNGGSYYNIGNSMGHAMLGLLAGDTSISDVKEILNNREMSVFIEGRYFIWNKSAEILVWDLNGKLLFNKRGLPGEKHLINKKLAKHAGQFPHLIQVKTFSR